MPVKPQGRKELLPFFQDLPQVEFFLNGMESSFSPEYFIILSGEKRVDPVKPSKGNHSSVFTVPQRWDGPPAPVAPSP